jgi:hypothetical protein
MRESLDRSRTQKRELGEHEENAHGQRRNGHMRAEPAQCGAKIATDRRAYDARKEQCQRRALKDVSERQAGESDVVGGWEGEREAPDDEQGEWHSLSDTRFTEEAPNRVYGSSASGRRPCR